MRRAELHPMPIRSGDSRDQLTSVRAKCAVALPSTSARAMILTAPDPQTALLGAQVRLAQCDRGLELGHPWNSLRTPMRDPRARAFTAVCTRVLNAGQLMAQVPMLDAVIDVDGRFSAPPPSTPLPPSTLTSASSSSLSQTWGTGESLRPTRARPHGFPGQTGSCPPLRHLGMFSTPWSPSTPPSPSASSPSTHASTIAPPPSIDAIIALATIDVNCRPRRR